MNTSTINHVTWMDLKPGGNPFEYEQVYPCRCGQTHRGEYGQEDWNHHNCYHQSPLVWIERGAELMCMDCGETFLIAEGKMQKYKGKALEVIARLRSVIERARGILTI